MSDARGCQRGRAVASGGVRCAVALLVCLIGCGNPAGGATGGPEVFQSVCAACHGLAGTPDPAMVARLGVKDLNAAEFRTKVTIELVENQVRTGSKNKLMPSFEGALTDAQIRAVAAYVSGTPFP